ncbi:SDR family NAD(P)-dependent oxidoreductase [Virgibacillus halophilus]
MPTVAITGAGSGLGRALALEYAKNNYHVYLLGRTDNKLHMVMHEIYQQKGSAEIVICDVAEPASVSLAFQQIGTLDVLINNAGIGAFGPIAQYSLEDIERMLNTNVKGTILAVQSALELIRKTHGRILNIISTAGLRGKIHESIYCASKFAVRGFTESLRKELQDESVRVTAVYMGGMNTPFWDKHTHVDKPENLKGAESVAAQIFNEDDGRETIYIDR